MMKYLNPTYALASLLALAILGCKHPSEPASTPTFSQLDGEVFQLDTTRSNFDTAVWLPSVGVPVRLLETDTVALTNSAAYYWFLNLNLTDATLSVNQPGYANVTVVHAHDLNSYPEPPRNLTAPYAPCNIFLVPESWLQVTLDPFQPNIDTSIISKRIGVETDARGDTTNFGTLVYDTEISPGGLYTIAHIHSMRADKPSLGYVRLYISTKPDIDPTDPATFNILFGNNPVRDSTMKITLPQNIGQSYGQNISPGTTVFCKAYAYPCANTPVYASDQPNKPIISGLGTYPSNTMTFNVP